MPALSKASLKSIWVNYFQPTSSNFSDLIDSWTDYYVSLQAIGQAVSAGSTGLVNITSTSTVSFLAVGATGQDLAATATAASARSVLGLGTLATQSTVSAANIEAASVSAAAIVDNSITLAKLARVGTTGQTLISNGAAADVSFQWSAIIQQVSYSRSDYVTGTTTTPSDDTIPQNTEGTEFLTVTITPKSASSNLLVEVNACMSTNANAYITSALFRDSTANAIAAVGQYYQTNEGFVASMRAIVASGSTAATSFKMRSGGNVASTVALNGVSGARLYGGVAASSITVTEIA